MLKLSGEALAGEQGFGIEPQTIQSICQELAEAASMGVQLSMVIGGGNIGLRLARALEKKPIHVKLLDKSPERCAELAGELDRTVVLVGDGTDQEGR